MTSPFAIRGVIEGFYGNPWTQAQRLELVRFIAERGLNTFVYGPKDDPLVRRDWRLPYDGDALARLRELLATCEAHGVNLVYCTSPGLSIEYSSEADATALSAKLASVAALGVRHFGLLLDDIPMELQHDADRAAFADLVDAHATLIGRVRDGLAPDHGLVVCPTVYCGYGDEDYVARLGAAIDPAVDLFWTGREICSHVLDLDDARRFERATGRPPLYWDNYPVNDVAMTFELHVGPYLGRHPRLHERIAGHHRQPDGAVRGVEDPARDASRTTSPDPVAYEPEASWARAIRAVDGAMPTRAGTPRPSRCSRTTSAARASTRTTRPRSPVRSSRSCSGSAGVTSRAPPRTCATWPHRLRAAADHLLRGDVANAALIDECRPWIEAFELGAGALAPHRGACRGGPPRPGRPARTPSLSGPASPGTRPRLSANAVDMTLADLTATQVRPGRQLPVRGGETA